MKQHGLGHLLVAIAVVLGVLAFVIALIDVPPITGVAIPVFIVVMLVVLSIFAGFLGLRVKRR
jgi:hypothetical protein